MCSKWSKRFLFLLLLFPLHGLPDSRQVFTNESPRWLESVGLLKYENRDQQAPHCSAFLINDSNTAGASLVLTAGHCIGSDPHPVITFMPRDGVVIRAPVEKVLLKRFGNFDGADFALLRLAKELTPSEVTALQVSDLPFSATAENAYGLLQYPLRELKDRQAIREAYWKVSELDADAYKKRFGVPKPFGTIAGFSADAGLGKLGSRLTYDDRCDFIDGHRELNTTVWCTAYPGASGGPFVMTMDRGNGTEYLAIGLLSGGTGVIAGQLRMMPIDTPDLRRAIAAAFEAD